MIQALPCHTKGKMKTIFVSSTFKDMHYERDAIRDITAPSLNEEAKKHGDELDFCDLRWGINTGDMDTEEGSKKVLDVCLDEIDRSEPPMVVLLGYRYGWIPEADLIKTAAERKQLELDDLRRSVTALEIEYGALCDEKKFKNTLFYFREIEGDAPYDYLAEDREHEEKISALKNRIKNITGGKVKEYTLKWNGDGFDGIKEFAEILAEDIKDILMPEWEETENLTLFQRERRTHAAFIREKNVMFRARQTEAEKLIKDALSQHVTIIKGEVGSGKSTLFSHMVTELEKTKWTVLPFISGLTLKSNSARDIIENTIYFIEEELKLDHYIDEVDSRTSDIGHDIGEDETAPMADKKKEHTPDEWREKLAEMCSAYAKTGAKLLIMVDAADQLTQSEERDKLHFIPMSVSKDIHFVMTCTMDFKTPGREHDTLRQLNNEDKQEVISGILARNGRELSSPVINEILKLEASDNPLYLSLLVQRLLMMNREDFTDIKSRGDGMAAIEQHQLELIRNKCPDDLDEMSAALLSEAGKRINEKLVAKAAEYLAVSRNGLRRKDLATLLGEEWSEIDFSHFVNYMYDCFLLRDDGRYDFTHKSIRAGFRRQCEDLDKVNSQILSYLKSLVTDDPVRMSEIIYHTIKADDKKFLVEYLNICTSIEKSLDNRPFINHVARDIYVQCIIDNGQWIIDVLNEAKKYKADGKLCNLTDFCNFELNKSFSGSLKELEISLSIMTANADLSECLYDILKTRGSKRILSISYIRVAEIYEKLGGSDNLQCALELYKKGLTINEQLTKKLDTAKSKRNLLVSYNGVAKIYEELGGSDNLQCALELYKKGLTISEQLAKEFGSVQNKRHLSVSYERLVGIYEKFDGSDNLQYALELSKKSLTIREQLAKELGTAESKRDLFVSYQWIALIYDELGGSDNLQQALELSRKALTISEQLAKELGTMQSKRDLSICYDRAAGIYEGLGGSDNLQQALELSRKALTISEPLAKELGTAESKRSLSICYHSAAGIYEKLGGNDNLQQALELSRKALTISEPLAAELDTAQSKEDLSTCYHRVASIYEELGGNDNLQQALELYGKALTIREQLAKELGTSESKKELSISYSRVGGVYKALGGSDNLQHALALSKKCLTIREQLAAELGTPQSKRNLSSSYHNVAHIYERLGGSDNLRQALELYGKALTIREQLAKELGTPQSKRDLSTCYYSVASIYDELGGSDNLRQALELYGKALTISEQIAKELGTAESKKELSISYSRVGGVYKALGGSDNLQYALALSKKCSTISEQLAKELGTVESKGNLSVSYFNVARIYEELGGSDNLAQALELYYKALAISEALANTLQTGDAYDDLAVCLLKIAKHPSTATPDKKALLARSLKISKDLYTKTNLAKYKSYIDECEELLKE